MPSQSQYLDSKFLFPHGYRGGNKCIGWSATYHRPCNNPIGQGKHLRHLVLVEQLNELTPAEQIVSPLLEQAVELHLCHRHVKTHLASELEKAQRKLVIADDEYESQDAAQSRPATTRGRRVENTTLPAARPEAHVATRRNPTTQVLTAHIPATYTPGVRFAPTAEPLVGYTPSPSPAAARRATPAVNDYTSEAFTPAARPPQARAARFWEPAAEFGNRSGEQPRNASLWARAEPLTPPTTPPSFRASTPDSDATLGRIPGTTAAAIYIPSDSEDGSALDDDDDDEYDGLDDEEAEKYIPGYPIGFWIRYDKKWDSLQDNGLVKGTPKENQIPWPIHGNSYPTPQNVTAFYQDAVLGVADRIERIRLMGDECRRWAPKNLKKVLGRRIFKGMCGETLQMIYDVAKTCHDRLINGVGGE